MKKNNKKGFTLVELVIVVAVMAVLVAVAIPTVKSVVGTAKTATYETNCRTLESVIKLADAEASNKDETFGATEVIAAVNKAKLGIVAPTGEGADLTTVTFYYDMDTGNVGKTAPADNFVKIVFDSTGSASQGS